MRHILFFCLFASVATYGAQLIQHSPRPLQAEASVEALVPWETPVQGFFIRSHHDLPSVDPARWTLTIDGLVKKRLKLSLRDLEKMPRRTLHAVLECSGNGRALQTPRVAGVQWMRGAVGNAEWSGASVAELLKRAGVLPGAKYARLEGADYPLMAGVPAFVRSVPIEKLMKGDSLIALLMNRDALTPHHGGPARLVLPGWYGENWTKWITKITLTSEEDMTFYMKKAYRMPRKSVAPGEAWDSATGVSIEEILVQSLITQPLEGSEVQAGTVKVSGKAFSGAGAITKVEISADLGVTWLNAIVEPAHASGGWQEFSVEIPLKADATLWSRASDSAGHTQPLKQEWNPGGYVRNAVDAVKISVKGAGLAVLKTKCLTCHSQDLISSQRLSATQWEGVFKKMQTFGVKLEEEEKTSLSQYLASHSQALAANQATLDYDRSLASLVAPPGKGARGQKIYSLSCAACHGTKQEGGVGPRLKARRLPWNEFVSTLREGRGLMPPLASALSKQDMADLHALFQ